MHNVRRNIKQAMSYVKVVPNKLDTGCNIVLCLCTFATYYHVTTRLTHLFRLISTRINWALAPMHTIFEKNALDFLVTGSFPIAAGVRVVQVLMCPIKWSPCKLPPNRRMDLFHHQYPNLGPGVAAVSSICTDKPFRTLTAVSNLQPPLSLRGHLNAQMQRSINFFCGYTFEILIIFTCDVLFCWNGSLDI